MIQREYTTEYDKHCSCVMHTITISTNSHHVFKTIKAYAESVCESEDYSSLCEDAESDKGGDEE